MDHKKSSYHQNKNQSGVVGHQPKIHASRTQNYKQPVVSAVATSPTTSPGSGVDSSGGKVKVVGYKVRAVSREAPGYKASNLADPDPRTCWSTGTNGKEWVVLELEQPVLLSQCRINNKSVQEWEITAALTLQAFQHLDSGEVVGASGATASGGTVAFKVRSRVEAPRREGNYPAGHHPARFVRITCFRGSPVAVSHVLLTGIPVPHLVPELALLVDHLLPSILAHMRDLHDPSLTLLREVGARLGPLLPLLRPELQLKDTSNTITTREPATPGQSPAPGGFTDRTVQFLTALVGPLFPLVALVTGQRMGEDSEAAGEEAGGVGGGGGGDIKQGSSSKEMTLQVSSNFAKVRKGGHDSKSSAPLGALLALKVSSVVGLVRVAEEDPHLHSLCCSVAHLLTEQAPLLSSSLAGGGAGEAVVLSASELEALHHSLAGTTCEALMQLLFACAAHPHHARALAGSSSSSSCFVSQQQQGAQPSDPQTQAPHCNASQPGPEPLTHLLPLLRTYLPLLRPQLSPLKGETQGSSAASQPGRPQQGEGSASASAAAPAAVAVAPASVAPQPQSVLPLTVQWPAMAPSSSASSSATAAVLSQSPVEDEEMAGQQVEDQEGRGSGVLRHWRTTLVESTLAHLVGLTSGPRFTDLLAAAAMHLSCGVPTQEHAARVLVDLCTSGPLEDWLAAVVDNVDIAVQIILDFLPVLPSNESLQDSTHFLEDRFNSQPQARAVVTLLKLTLSGLAGTPPLLSASSSSSSSQLLFLLEMLETPLTASLKPPDSGNGVFRVRSRSGNSGTGVFRGGGNGNAASKVGALAPDSNSNWNSNRISDSESEAVEVIGTVMKILRAAASRGGPLVQALENRWRSGEISSEVVVSMLLPTHHLSTSIAPYLRQVSPCHTLNEARYPGGTTSTRIGSLAAEESLSAGRVGKGWSGGEVRGGSDSRLCSRETAEEFFHLQAEYSALMQRSTIRTARAHQFQQLGEYLHGLAESKGKGTPHGKEYETAAVEAILIAGECHLNPFFCVSPPVVASGFAWSAPREWLRDAGSRSSEVGRAEKDRDMEVMRLLLRAAEWMDTEGGKDGSVNKAPPLKQAELAAEDIFQDYDPESFSLDLDPQMTELGETDVVTLIRHHQHSLGALLVRELQQGGGGGGGGGPPDTFSSSSSLREVVLQGLLCLLRNATPPVGPAEQHQVVPPEVLADAILNTAARLSHCLPARPPHSQGSQSPPLFLPARRMWSLLHGLVSCCCSDAPRVSAEVWLQRLSSPGQGGQSFAASPLPLVRYIGWMATASAVSVQAQHSSAALSGVRLPAGDMPAWTLLLSIFTDPICATAPRTLTHLNHTNHNEDATSAAFADSHVDSSQSNRDANSELDTETNPKLPTGGDRSSEDREDSGTIRGLASGSCVSVVHPDLIDAFPTLHVEFCGFAESILEAVCVRVQCVPAVQVPTLLAWFGEMCAHGPLNPRAYSSLSLAQDARSEAPGILDGSRRAFAKVVLRLFQTIVDSHFEEVLKDAPRLIEATLCLCENPFASETLVRGVLESLNPLLEAAIPNPSEDPSHSLPSAASSSTNAMFVFESVAFDLLLTRLASAASKDYNTSTSTSASTMNPRHPSNPDQESGSTAPSDLFLLVVAILIPHCSTPRTLQLLDALASWTRSPEDWNSGSLNVTVRLESFNSVLQGINTRIGGGGSTELGADAVITTNLIPPTFASPQEGTVAVQPTIPRSQAKGLEKGMRDSVLGMLQKLGPCVEAAWDLHPTPTSQVANTVALCLSHLLGPTSREHSQNDSRGPDSQEEESDEDQGSPCGDEEVLRWGARLHTLGCWRFSHMAMMDPVLNLLPTLLPRCLTALARLTLDRAAKAPRLEYRVQAAMWTNQALRSLQVSAEPGRCEAILNLPAVLLRHPEPEVRAAILRPLPSLLQHWDATCRTPVPSKALCHLARSTWQPAVTLAANDALPQLRQDARLLILRLTSLVDLTHHKALMAGLPAVCPLFAKECQLETSDSVSETNTIQALLLAGLLQHCLHEAKLTLPAIVITRVTALVQTHTGGPSCTFSTLLAAILEVLKCSGTTAPDVPDRVNTAERTIRTIMEQVTLQTSGEMEVVKEENHRIDDVGLTSATDQVPGHHAVISSLADSKTQAMTVLRQVREKIREEEERALVLSQQDHTVQELEVELELLLRDLRGSESLQQQSEGPRKSTLGEPWRRSTEERIYTPESGQQYTDNPAQHILKLKKHLENAKRTLVEREVAARHERQRERARRRAEREVEAEEERERLYVLELQKMSASEGTGPQVRRMQVPQGGMVAATAGMRTHQQAGSHHSHQQPHPHQQILHHHHQHYPQQQQPQPSMILQKPQTTSLTSERLDWHRATPGAATFTADSRTYSQRSLGSDAGSEANSQSGGDIGSSGGYAQQQHKEDNRGPRQRPPVERRDRGDSARSSKYNGIEQRSINLGVSSTNSMNPSQ